MIFNIPTVLTLGSLLLVLGVNASVEKRIGGVLAGAPVNNITVKADNVVQCSQATISWSGTSSGPVSLSIGQGGYYVGQTTLETHEGITDSTYTWTVTQSEGTSLIFEVQDSAGQRNYVQNVKVSGSPDTSCLADTSASSAPSAVAGSSSASAVGESASVVRVTSTSSWSEPSSSAAQETAPSSSSSKSKSKSAASSQSASSPAASSTIVPTPATTISLTSTGSAPGSTSNVPSAVSASTSSSGITAPLAAASGGASSGSTSQITIHPLSLGLGGMVCMLGGWLI